MRIGLRRLYPVVESDLGLLGKEELERHSDSASMARQAQRDRKITESESSSPTAARYSYSNSYFKR